MTEHLIPTSRLTLVPLSMGVVLAQVLSCSKMMINHIERNVLSLKWPNDVLIDDKKVAGILIENCSVPTHKGSSSSSSSNSSNSSRSENWLLIGIGVNVQSCPQEFHDQETTAPRMATCLKEHTAVSSDFALELGMVLSQQIPEQIQQFSQDGFSSSIVDQWVSFAKLGEYYTIRTTGEIVQIIQLEADGRMRVVGKDGKERLLVSDYFV
mmetsp:Transcript_9162/g.16035  ORF Transcript_9162/g.16035 Transcript_9162/m.16035 type:complete len:210 (-) Transcript_9162:19-648(-)